MPLPTHVFVRRLSTALLVVSFPALSGADGVVTDTNATSLRAALAGGGTVHLVTTGMVVLPGTIIISNKTALVGSNHSAVISGAHGRGGGPLFRVIAGGEFSVSGLTLANGNSTLGGAIYNAGTLVLNDCVFSNNIAAGATGAVGIAGSPGTILGTIGGFGLPGTAAAGGAIYNLETAVVANCTFITNQAVGGSGGIGGTGGASNYQGGDGGGGGLAASGAGGAIYSTGSLQISNTLFRSNAARGGAGGTGGTNGFAPIPGASGDGGPGASAFGGAVFATSAAILASTFHGNAAIGGDTANAAADTRNFNGVSGTRGPDAFGGAVFSQGALDIVNCTFATNTVAGGKGGNGGNGLPYGGDGANGGNAWGGSVYSDTGAVTHVTNCTVAAGAAIPGAAGLRGTGVMGQDGLPGKPRGANIANSGSLVLRNTILAYPTNSVNADGTIIDGLGNLSSDGTPSSFLASRRNTDPMLMPLANNGGPTPTMLPRFASPAVNGGDCEGTPPVDQRGYPRDGTCDVGAVEIQSDITPLANVASTNNQLLVSWPARASHYALLSAYSLADSAWTPVTNAPKIAGDVLSIAIPITPTNKVRFFRLEPK